MSTNQTDPKKNKKVITTSSPDLSTALKQYAKKENITTSETTPLMASTVAGRDTQGGTFTDLDSENRKKALVQALKDKEQEDFKKQQEALNKANTEKLQQGTKKAEEITNKLTPVFKELDAELKNNPVKQRIKELESKVNKGAYSSTAMSEERVQYEKELNALKQESIAYEQALYDKYRQALNPQELKELEDHIANPEFIKKSALAQAKRTSRHQLSELYRKQVDQDYKEASEGDWTDRNLRAPFIAVVGNATVALNEGMENIKNAVTGQDLSDEEKEVNRMLKPASFLHEMSIRETMTNFTKAQQELIAGGKVRAKDRTIYKSTMSSLQRQLETLQDVRDGKGFSASKLWEGVVGDNIGATGKENFDYSLLRNIRKNFTDLLYDNVQITADGRFEEYLVKTGKKAEDVTEEEYKTEVFEKLSPTYQQALIAKGVLQEVEGYNHANAGYWYKAVEGASFSAEMMLGMVAGSGVVSLGNKAINRMGMSMNIVNNVNRASRLRGFLTSLGAGEKLSASSLKALQLGQKLGSFGVASIATTYFDPMFINERLKKETQLLKDENGNIDVAMTGEALRGKYVREFEDEKKIMSQIVSKLDGKQGLSEEEQQSLAYAKARLGQGTFLDPSTATEVTSIEEDLEEVNEVPESQFEAHVKGILLTANERFSEMYTAKALGAVGKGLDNQLTKGYLRFANKPYAFAKNSINKFSDFASYDTILGKMYGGFTRGVKQYTSFDGVPLVGGIGEEMIEEYVAQLGQSVIDWSTEPLKEAMSADFLKDVAGQTLILNGFMGGASTSYKNLQLSHNYLVKSRAEKLEAKLAELNKKRESEAPEYQKDYDQAIADITKEIAKAKDKNTLTGLGLTSATIGNTSLVAKRAQEQKDFDKLIRDLKSVEDEDTSEALSFINGLSRDAKTEGERAQEVKLLRLQGKTVEADLVEKAMLSTVIAKASATNSLGELQHALEKSLDKVENIDTIKNIQTTLKTITKAQTFLGENTNHPNKKAVVQFMVEEGLIDSSIDQTKSILQKGKQQASEDFERLFQAKFSNQNEVSFVEAEQLFLSGDLDTVGVSDAKATILENIQRAVENSSSTALKGYAKGMALEKYYKGRKNEINTIISDLIEPTLSTANAELFIKALYKKHKEYTQIKSNENVTEEEFKVLFEDLAETWNSGKSYRRIDKAQLEKIKNNGLQKIREYKQAQEFTKAMMNRISTIQNAPEEDIEITEFTGTHAEIATRSAIADMEGEIFADNPMTQGDDVEELPTVVPTGAVATPSPDSDITSVIVEDNIFGDDSLMFEDENASLDADLLETVSQGLKKVVKYLNFQTGQAVTFSQAIETIVAFESQAGKLVFGGNRYRYFVEAWKALGGQFTQGEQYTLLSELRAKSQELSGRGEVFEAMKSSYLENNPFNMPIDVTPLAQISVEPVLNAMEDTQNDAEESKELPKAPESKVEVTIPIEGGTGSVQEVFGQTKAEIEEEIFQVVNREMTEIGKAPKLGFSTIAYENVLNEFGQVVRKSVNTDTLNSELDAQGFIQVNPKPLLHPDNTSYDLTVEVAKEEDWDKIKVFSEFIDELGNVKTLSFAEYVTLKEASNPNYRNSEEFLNKIPIFAVKNGVRVAYIHDSDWFNPYNVKDPTIQKDRNTGEILNYTAPRDYETNALWVQAIEDDKARNTRLRKAIIKHGITSFSYRPDPHGKVGETANGDLIRLSEANPQATILIQTGTSLSHILANDLPKNFSKDGDSVLLNGEREFDTDTRSGKPQNKNGHTWAIYRVGTKVMPTGETKKTYRAVPIHRNMERASEIINSIQWAIAIHKVLSGENVPSIYKLSPEVAKEYQKNFFNSTGLDLSNKKDVENYLLSFGKLTPEATKEVNDALKEKGKEGNNSSINFFAMQKALFETAGNPPSIKLAMSRFVQSSHKPSLNNKSYKVSFISAKGVTPYTTAEGKHATYEEYLKESLQTTFKAYNMAEQGQAPVYGLVIQPILEIEDSFEGVEFQAEVASEGLQALKVASQKAIEEIAETKEEAPVTPLTEQEQNTMIDFLSDTMGITLDMFGDNAFGNVEALKNLFDQITELKIRHENIIVDYISSIITEKAEYRERISASNLDEIRAIAKKRLTMSFTFVMLNLNKSLDNLSSTPSTPKTEALTKAINKALADMAQIEANYNALFDKAAKRVELISNVNLDSLEELEDDSTSDEDLVEKNHSKDSIEETVKAKAGAKLRMLFSGIPVLVKTGKKDAQGNDEYEPELGYANIPRMMSLDDVYNLVLKTLSVGTDLTADFDVMISKLQKNTNPTIKIVLARLKNSDAQVKNQFVVNSAMHSLTSRFAMYQNKEDGSVELKYYDTNSSTVKDTVKKKWLQNSISTDLYDGEGNFNDAYANKLLDEFRKFSPSYEQANLSQVRAWLEKLGIELHDKTWEQFVERGVQSGDKHYGFKAMYEAGFKNNKELSLFQSLISFLEKGAKDSTNYGIEQNNIFKELVGITNGLAEMEAINNPEMISLVFRDTGKTISTLTPPKYITDTVASLINSAKGDQKLIDEILSFDFSSESLLLKTLKGRPDFVEEFAVHHIALTAIKEKNEKVVRNKKMPSLDEIDYFLTALTAFQDRKRAQFSKSNPASENMIPLRIADMVMPTMSDKDTVLSLSTVVLDTLAKRGVLYSKDETGQIVMGEQIKKTLYEQVVKPELFRIWKKHNSKTNTNIKAYDAVSGLFHLVPKLNAVQINGENIVRYLANNSAILTFKQVEELFESALTEGVSEVVTQEARKYTKVFKEVGLEVDEAGNPKKNLIFDDKYFKEAENGADPVKDFEYGVWDFVVNSFVFNADMYKVFIGDISVYDKSTKPKDRDIYSLTEEEYVAINKQTGVNLGKRLALLIAPGRKINNPAEDTSYLQIFLQDSKDISENARQLISWYYPNADKAKANALLSEYDTLYKRRNLVEQYNAVEGKIFKKEQLLASLNDRLGAIKTSLKNSFPEIGDYFDIESTDAQEYTTVGEHLHVMYNYGRISEREYNRLSELFKSGQKFEPEDLKIVMQPMKPVHTGMYNQKQFGVRRPVYIKTSSFPLIPQVTRGTSLDALRQGMERLEEQTGKRVRASYQSGNKVGATINTINPTDVNSVEQIFTHITGNGVTLDTGNVVMELDRNNFRIQQDTPYKSGKRKIDNVSMGTQIFKLLLGDGMADVKEAVFPFKGQMLTGREITDKFKESFQVMFDRNLEQLYDELGLPADGTIENEEDFILALQDLLKREATSRNYPLKSIKGLEMRRFQIGEADYYDFATPLWLSSDSNKYEALLNSIITNRLMKFKISGNGYIAGSEKGFDFVENIDDVQDKNKIIYLSGWNGKELQATKNKEGKIQTAQVMVESKFRDNNGKMIDLFKNFNEETQEGDYIKKSENGTLSLKEEMFHPDTLKMFTFRTPTSSHVSGSSVQIVGILPPGSGDLMVVPKNFTKQKGLDFDIDKESAYFYNLFVDDEGKIAPLEDSPEALKASLGRELIYKEVKEVTAEYKSVRRQLQADVKLAKYRRAELVYQLKVVEGELEYLKDMLEEGSDEYTFEEIEASFEALQEERRLLIAPLIEDNHTIAEIYNTLKELTLDLEAEKADIFATVHQRVKSKVQRKRVRQFEKKVAENDFIRVHLAVYDSPSDEVQRRINKILSMKFAGEQAEKLEALVEQGTRTARLVELKAEGATEEQALTQYGKEQNNFSILSYGYQKAKMDLGAIGKKAIGIYAVATTFNGQVQQTFGSQGAPVLPFTIGKFTSSSLGSVYTIGSSTYTSSEMLAEKENTATDNEKEQILGRVGINDETIGVDAYGSVRGFGKDENGNSILYLLVSQPSIKAFNDKKKKSKGILGSFFNEEDEIDLHIREISGGQFAYGPDPMSESMIPPLVFFDIQTGRKIAEQGSPILTGDAMLSGIEEGKIEGTVQAHAFMTFINLKKEGNSMVSVMGAFNTNVIGKSMSEALHKRTRLANSLFNKNFPDFYKMLGEQVPSGTKGAYTFTNSTGEKEMTIKPTTPQGLIAIKGLMIHDSLFSKYFPINQEVVVRTVNNILFQQGISEDYMTAEDLEGVIIEMKKYINSTPSLGLYNGDAETKRYELFTDDGQNTSLAMYLKKTVKSDNPNFQRGIKALADNILIGRKLSFEVNKGKDQNSIISFNNASTDFIDDSELYQALVPLVLEDMALPDRNGLPYSTRQLVQDLVAYSFLEGGVQEATQFMKYIPVEMYDVMGAEIGGKFQSISVLLQKYNPQRSSQALVNLFLQDGEAFTRQYFQNNPMKAKKASYRDYKKTEGVLTPKEGKLEGLNYIRITDNNQTSLWERTSETTFEEIPMANSSYISQYTLGQKYVTPIRDLKRSALADREVLPDSENPMMEALLKATSIEEAFKIIAQSSLPKDFENLPNIAEMLIPYINLADEGKRFAIENDSLPMNIAGNTNYSGEVVVKGGMSPVTTVKKIIHEGLHHLTVRDLNKYYYENEKGEYLLREGWVDPKDNTVKPIPVYVYELNTVFAESKKHIQSEMLKKYKTDVVTQVEKAVSALKVAKQGGIDTEAFKTAKADVDRLVSLIDAKDFETVYGVANVKEFISALFESEDFRGVLNNKTYKKTQASLYNRLISVIRKMITRIFPEIKTNSLAEQGLIQALNFLEIERAKPKLHYELVQKAEALTKMQQAYLNKTSQQAPKFEAPPTRQEKPTAQDLEGAEIIADDLSLFNQNNINFVKTDLGHTIESLGVLQSEWNELSEEEKEKIKACN